MVLTRGGEGLIRFVAEHARVPVIKHYKGVCHLYVDAAADPALRTRMENFQDHLEAEVLTKDRALQQRLLGE